jgi:hypothetical protein
MPYTPHVLVAFGGSWVNDATEIWECTVRISGDGGGGVTIDPDAYLADVAGPLGIWYHGAQMDVQASLTWVKANHIAADGTYVDKTVTHLRDFAPAILGSLTHTAPGFCSIAYTWETALLRGPGHRGRVYPPNGSCVPAANFNAAFRIGNQADYAANGAGLLAVLKNAAGADGTKGTPVVASKVNGALTPIIGCSADTIFDVQRRRKNRIKGNRSAIVPFA